MAGTGSGLCGGRRVSSDDAASHIDIRHIVMV